MNVLYDYQILYEQKYGGISRYFFELISEIQLSELANVRINCFKSINSYFSGLCKETDGFLNVNNVYIRRVCRLFGHIKNKCSFYFDIRNGVDVIHPTYYDTYLLHFKKVPKVITIYDMIHEKGFIQGNNKKIIEQKKRWIYGADHIIAISESTKNDIIAIYPDINPNKISVIYIGTRLKDEGLTVDFLPNKYVLFVGRRSGYKNFKVFNEAMCKIMEIDKDICVVCVGGGVFTRQEMELLGKYKERFYQYDMEDDVLAAAYKNAECFVFPSLYEGFGIPTLEAFACECPAILSYTSSMPEVGGDAALYFDPTNGDDLAKKLKCVLYDGSIRKELVIKGNKQLEKFSWSGIANETVKCYSRIIEEHISD